MDGRLIRLFGALQNYSLTIPSPSPFGHHTCDENRPNVIRPKSTIAVEYFQYNYVFGMQYITCKSSNGYCRTRKGSKFQCHSELHLPFGPEWICMNLR